MKILSALGTLLASIIFNSFSSVLKTGSNLLTLPKQSLISLSKAVKNLFKFTFPLASIFLSNTEAVWSILTNIFITLPA